MGGLWVTTFYVVAFRFILPQSEKWNSNWKRIYPYVLLTCSLVFFGLGTQFLDDYSFTSREITLWFWFSILNYMTFWMIMYLQKTMKEIESVSQKMIQFEKDHTINHLLIFISQQLSTPLDNLKEMMNNVKKNPLTSQQSYLFSKIDYELNQAALCLEQILEDQQVKQGERSGKQQPNLT